MTKRIPALLILTLLIAAGCEIPLGQEKEKPHNPPHFPLMQKDSLAARSFLQANGLGNLPLEGVIGASYGRISGVYLYNRGLTDIVLTNDFDSVGTIGFDLALEKNLIQKVTVRDTIRRSMLIRLFDNNLKDIPSEFLRINGDVTLWLNRNKIDSIAPEALSSGIVSLDVAENRLCDVPDSIAQWLDTVDPDWRESQVCD